MPGERMTPEEAQEFFSDLSYEDFLKANAGKPFKRGDWVIAVQGPHAYQSLQVTEVNPDGSLKLKGEDEFNFIESNNKEVFHLADFEQAKKYAHGPEQ